MAILRGKLPDPSKHPPSRKFQLVLRDMRKDDRYGYSITRVFYAEPPVHLFDIMKRVEELIAREK